MLTGFKNIYILIFVLIITSDFVFAQKTPANTDSTKVYRDIESFSIKRKSTKFIYRLVFRPVVVTSPQKNSRKKVYKNLVQKSYSNFEGKIIRHIQIETLDPFGYSIADTLVRQQNFLTKSGNKLHMKSHRLTINNLLLIRQNQVFDLLLLKESERLVRARGFVRDVSFFVKDTSPISDSVDIFIRELDNWSLIPALSASTSHVTVNLSDKNFLGLGHESKNGYTWNHTNGTYAYNVHYFVPNFRNTYINSTFFYNRSESGSFDRSFAIDRPFFSPLAKWAAGVNFAKQFRDDSIHTSNSLYLKQRIKFNMQDYWAGNAIQIFKDNSEYSRTTNFISAARFVRIRYLEKPIETYDTAHLYSNEDFYLASVGISTRRYVQDTYIFKYGILEDVPVGKVYSLTGGYQKKHDQGRYYLGARISSGNYYPWGYLSFNSEIGTFFNGSHPEQGILALSVNYFTGLFEMGKWKLRQFVKPQVTIGMNRLANDSLTINDSYGLDGFNSTALSGTSRLLLTLQTQSYAPWNFIGFRFGPYLNLSFGMLGNAETGFRNGKIYSQIGFGVLIKNENLVINTFQISLAFYPLIPGKGQNIFKMNSFRSTDFGFKDFEIGKPATVNYQ